MKCWLVILSMSHNPYMTDVKLDKIYIRKLLFIYYRCWSDYIYRIELFLSYSYYSYSDGSPSHPSFCRKRQIIDGGGTSKCDHSNPPEKPKHVRGFLHPRPIQRSRNPSFYTCVWQKEQEHRCRRMYSFLVNLVTGYAGVAYPALVST